MDNIKAFEPKIKGISGLAALLGCSLPTAQRIKQSGKIPFYQVGKIVFFDREEVLEAIRKNPSTNA